MGRRSWFLLLLGVLAAYCIYTPLPENIEELMLTNTPLKAIAHLATFLEFLGLGRYFDFFTLMMIFPEVPPTSDKNVIVTDTKFNNIPVRVYVPRRKSDTLRRSVFYIHGGGWSLGSAAFISYDLLSRKTADRLDAVVVSTNYRLAPKYHFPVQFEDVYDAIKWFLRKNILEEYGVDPGRIAVSGDSSGGNLAAAVAQQLLDDPDVKIRLKVQSLIYPALQTLDLETPSYQDNAHVPVLPKSLAIWFCSNYITSDSALRKAMMRNQHVPVEAAPLFKLVNWSSLLPERFLKGHVYKAPTFGSSELARKHPGFLDVRVAPLLAADSKLRDLPRTYLVTCQYDILRDDGFMYVRRLRDVGVPVTHNHVEDGFHGILSLPVFKIYYRLMDEYIWWLDENL
ncbi:arylacetamide deacetylase [Callospermophilus lateralis]|uniref:arylacetamide deacetylase n=1 Tax=Callospermophilus lateralis TaxID=76772 RepID=UPI004053CEFF